MLPLIAGVLFPGLTLSMLTYGLGSLMQDKRQRDGLMAVPFLCPDGVERPGLIKRDEVGDLFLDLMARDVESREGILAVHPDRGLVVEPNPDNGGELPPGAGKAFRAARGITEDRQAQLRKVGLERAEKNEQLAADLGVE